MKRFYVLFLLTLSVMISGIGGCEKNDPRSVGDLLKSGKLFLDANNHKRAITDLTMALKIAETPHDSTAAYTLRMLAYAKQGNYKKALAEVYNNILGNMNDVWEIRPIVTKWLDIDGNWGIMYTNAEVNEHVKELISALDMEILQRPKNSEAYVLRSFMYFLRNDDDAKKKAIDDLNKAALIRPKDAVLYFIMANLHAIYDDNDNAVAAINEAIRIQPKYIGFYSFRALLHSLNDNNDRALEDINEAIRLVNAGSSANINELYHLRSLAYRRNGDFERAIADFGLAFGSIGVDNLIRSGQASISRGCDCTELAIIELGVALQMAPDDTTAQRLFRRAVGDALRDNHKHSEALKALGQKALGTEVTATRRERITVINNTGHTGMALYLTNSDNDLGEDRLGKDILSNGRSVTIELPFPTCDVNRYTIVLVDSDYDMYVKRNILVRDGSRITFVYDDITS